MEIIPLQTREDVASRVHTEMERLGLATQGRLKCFLPTGASPKLLYQCMRADKDFWKDRLEVFQVDDYFCKSTSGAFKREVESEVINPIGISKYFHSIPDSPEAFLLHAAKVKSQEIDLAVLGLGPNGHVGFHEPHLPGDFSFGSVELGPETKQHLLDYNKRIGETTFDLNEDVIANTFGAATFARCKSVFMIVTGANKNQILKKLQTCNPQKELPASLLKNHPRFFIFADDAAFT